MTETAPRDGATGTAVPRCFVGSEVGHAPPGDAPSPGARAPPPRRRRPLESCCSTGCCGSGRAREEHDAFAAALASRGVEIVYLDDLLADVLEQPDVRERLVQTLGPPLLGPTLGPEVREWLTALSSSALAEHLIAGVTFDEFPFSERQHRRADGSRVRGAHRCRTRCSCATRRRGSTAACRSTRWRCRRASASPSTSRPCTAITRCSTNADVRGLERRRRRADVAGGRRHVGDRQRRRPGGHRRTHPSGRRGGPREAAVRGGARRRR